MIVWLGRALAFLLTAASGWAVSDVYNEHERAKQITPSTSIVESAKNAYLSNKGKWTFLTIATIAVFGVIMLVIKPMIRRGKTDQAIL
jgi:hypothetical protein